jgi:hypothetical protein
MRGVLGKMNGAKSAAAKLKKFSQKKFLHLL